VDAINNEGSDALHLASCNNHSAVVNILLLAGAHVGAKNQNGATALFYASIKGHAPIVEILLKAGADTKVKDADGLTVLIHASINGHAATVKQLFQASPNTGTENREWCEVPATVLSQRAFQVDPSFPWAPASARTTIFSWARDLFLLKKYALSFQPLVDLPDDCIGDVLEYLMSTVTRKETVGLSTHWPTPETHAWIRAVIAAALKMRKIMYFFSHDFTQIFRIQHHTTVPFVPCPDRTVHSGKDGLHC
jgi:hypothetical protein